MKGGRTMSTLAAYSTGITITCIIFGIILYALIRHIRRNDREIARIKVLAFKYGIEVLDKLRWIETNARIYSIHYSAGGVAFQFYESSRAAIKCDNPLAGLVYYHYYKTFGDAVKGEYERLRAKEKA
jgi:hypothetical protein